MKIRSITYFCNPGWPLEEEVLRKAGEFATAARPAFSEAGYEVQTMRLATPPFPSLLPTLADLPRLAQEGETLLATLGLDYLSLGPAVPEHLTSYEVIPEAIAATKNAFFSGSMTMVGNQFSITGSISLPAVRACAAVIQRSASLSPDGFANLRFAALANVPAGSPFFPAAYHDGGSPAFALATEAADLAVQAFAQAGSLAEARQELVRLMEENAHRLESTGQALAEQLGLRFGGIDFSLAPFPQESLSLGTALERLGVPALGLHGSLAAAAILADTMDQASFQRVGFSGLMLPVLEDATLARRAAEGTLTVRDMLLYSAVCGSGLDTVPLPGEVSAEQLNALLLDLAALARRLEKPLTARLMPIPGKKAGDLTGFDFAYFANSRVLALNAEPLAGLLAGAESFNLHRR